MWTVTQMKKTSMMTIMMILWIITKPRIITTSIMIEVIATEFYTARKGRAR